MRAGRLAIAASGSFVWVLWALTGFVACEGDDTTFARDGGPDATFDGTTRPDAVAPEDAGTDAVAPRPPWLLLTLSGSTESELVAFSIDARRVDGRQALAASAARTTAQDGQLFLLDQQNDRVVKLDPEAPWRGSSSWRVLLDDRPDGGPASADPVAVVPGPGNKAYVLRRNRNGVAVLDTAQVADGGAPSARIDLQALVDPADGDGRVDVVAGVHVPSQQRLYLVLGNLDRDRPSAAPGGEHTPCRATRPSLIAVDTTTDTLVSLGGSARGGGLPLPGFDPVPEGLLYDAPRARLLVVHAGCHVELPGDAGKGMVQRREIDEIVFAADGGGALVRPVLDLAARGRPSALARLDEHHVALGFDYGFEARSWDLRAPLDAGLGAQLPNAPDLFVHDGKGRLLGARTELFADGGRAGSLVSVGLEDGGYSVLGPIPRTEPATSTPTSVTFWPPP